MGWLKSQKKRSRARKSTTESTPVMSAEDQQEWLKGTPYELSTKDKKKPVVKKAPTAGKKAAAATAQK